MRYRERLRAPCVTLTKQPVKMQDKAAGIASMTPVRPVTSASEKLEAPSGSSIESFSLVVGGPFYALLRRLRLVEPAPNIGGRIAMLFALTWVPLGCLSALQGVLFGPKVSLPLLYDFSMYGRYFVGLPLLVIAEVVIDPRIRRVVTTFDKSGLIGPEARPRYHAALEGIRRLRDSRLAELLLLVLASLPWFMLVDQQEWISQGLTTWHGNTSGGLSDAGWWFVFVSSPILRFLLFRWLWRYLVWSLLLYRVMELDLNLMPTHPDLMGGLGFVLDTQRHFGILFAGIGSFIAGRFGNSIAYFGVSVGSTTLPMLAFVIIAVVVVLCPLTLLTPKLSALRTAGLARYDELARNLTESFDAKWTRARVAPRGSLLGSLDPSSLADFVSSYGVIRDLRTVPVDRKLLFQVAAEAAAPLAILWIAATPAEHIVAGVLKVLLF
jgi:hypothetical protein